MGDVMAGLWLFVLMCVFTLGCLVWLLYKKRSAFYADSSSVLRAMALDILWTIIPFVLVAGLLYPVMRDVQQRSVSGGHAGVLWNK